MKKVIITIFITICLTSILLLPVLNAGYNRDGALNYAQRWWNGANHNCGSYSSCSPFSYWGSEHCGYPSHGGDCANFVSQCILAGGEYSSIGRSYCKAELGADALKNWLKSKGWQVVKFGHLAAGPSNVIKGDAMFCCNSSGYSSHATIVVGTDRIACHSSQHYGIDPSGYYTDSAHAYFMWLHNPDNGTPKLAADIVEKEYSNSKLIRAGTISTGNYIKYKNVGESEWLSSVQLGTTNDAASSFYINDGTNKWIGQKRVCHAESTPVKRGEIGRFQFALKGPSYHAVKDYNLDFNLVRDNDSGVTWFSEDGGPGDHAVSFSLTVYPDRDYLKKWLILGPIPGNDITADHLRDADDFSASENSVVRTLWPDKDKRVYTKEKDYKIWKDVNTMSDNINFGDINGLNGKDTHCAKFLSVYVIAENKKPDCKLKLGANYGLKVWVNGEPVGFSTGNNSINPNNEGDLKIDEHTTEKFELNSGVNRLMIKATHAGTDSFRLTARIFNPTTDSNIDIGGLTYTPYLPAEVDLTPPDRPQLLSPANHTVLNFHRPELDWTAVTDPSKPIVYQLQVDSNTRFSDTVVTESTTSSKYQLKKWLPNDKYYWRVRARDDMGNFSNWTSTWAFIVDVADTDTVAPTNPTTTRCWSDKNKTVEISSDNWQNDFGQNPYFEWSGATDNSSGVNGYSVYFGTDSAKIPGQNVNVNHIIGKTIYQPTVVIPSEKKYYLRVRTADNSDNWSSATTLFVFRYDNTAPVTPKLSSPVDNSFQKTVTINFAWNKVTDFNDVRYDLQVSTNSNFSSTAINQHGITTNSFSTTTALNDGIYYCRIRSKDTIGNLSAWSIATKVGIDITKPTAVKTLTATNIGGGDIDIFLIC